MMSLKPLGLKDPLIPPTSLGQNFQSLQPPSPLGQNFQPLQPPPPLGQSPTSLGQSLEPLSIASYFDQEIETGDRGFGTWDGGGENPQILTNNPPNSQFSTPLTESASIGDNVASSKSNFSELANENLPQTTVRRKENDGSSSVLNAASLDSPTENIARFKPLGLSKPLAQESDFLISPSLAESIEKPQTSLQEIPDTSVVRASWQKSDVDDSAIATPSSSPPPSNPLVVQPIETEIPAAPATIQDTATPSIEPTSDISPSLETPTNVPVTSQEITAPQVETLAKDREDFPSPSLTNTSSVDAIVPDEQNFVSPSLETPTNVPETIPETAAPQVETFAKDNENLTTQNLTNTSSTVEETIASSQQNLVSPKKETPTPLPANNPLSAAPQVETFASDNENFTTQNLTTASLSDAIHASSQPNHIQTNLETPTPVATPPSATPQSETFVENREDFAFPSPTTNKSTTDAISQPNQVQLSKETSTDIPAPTEEEQTPQSETFVENREDLAFPSPTTTKSTNADAISQPNQVQLSKETSTDIPVSSQETAASQIETFALDNENIASSSLTDQPEITSEEISYGTTTPIAPSQPNLVSPSLETPTFASETIPETPAPQAKTSASDEKDFASPPPTNTSSTASETIASESPNLVSPRKETSNTASETTPLTSTPEGETFASSREEFPIASPTNTSSTAESPNLVSPRKETSTPVPATTPLTSTPEGETFASSREEFAHASPTNTSKSASETIASESQNLVSPKIETPNTASETIPETPAPKGETFASSREEFAHASPTNTSKTAEETIASESPNLVSPKIETPNTASETTPLTSTPEGETFASSREEFPHASPTNTSSTAEETNLVSPKIETPTSVPATTPLTSTPEGETFASSREEFAHASPTNTSSTAEETIASESPNLVSPKIETPNTASETIPETPAPKGETFASSREEFAHASPTNTSKTAEETNLVSPKIETPTSVPATTPLTSTPEGETFSSDKEEFAHASPTNTSKSAEETIASESQNLVSPKIETPNTASETIPETPAPKGETFASSSKDFASPSSTTTSQSDAISYATDAPNTPDEPNIVQASSETPNPAPTPTPKTNVVQPLLETPTPVPAPTQETAASQIKTFASDNENIATTSLTPQAKIASEPIAPDEPSLVQPSLETSISAPVPTKETVAPQEESFGKNRENFSLTSQTEQPEIASAPDASEQSDIVQPTLETPTNATASTPSTAELQGETFGENREFTPISPTTTSSTTPDTISQPNLIQTSSESTHLPAPTSEAVTSQSETFGENREFTPIYPTTTSSTTPDAISQPNLIQTSSESTHLPAPTSEAVTSQSETFGENREFTPIYPTTTSSTTPDAISQPNLIQTSSESTHLPAPTSEAVTSQSETFGENRQDFTPISPTTTSETVSETNAPPPPNLVQASSETPTDVSETIPETPATQIETFASDKADFVAPSQTTRSSTPSETNHASSQQNIVQPRRENQSLNSLKPLGFSKPLAQQSDFLTYELIADFIDKSPTTSQETPTSSSISPVNISKLPEDNLPNTSRSTEPKSPDITSQTAGNIPDSWSNISELLGENTNDTTENLPPLNPLGFSKPLSSANNFILPKLGLTSETGDQPNNTQKTSPTVSSNSANDVPTSWSNISELLGENSTTTPDINLTEEDEFAPLSSVAPETSYPSYTLSSPTISDSDSSDSSDISTSADSAETPQQLTANIGKKDSSVSNEQLEILAQKVYTLMRQRLEIEQERQGKSCVGNPTWLGNITSSYGTSAKVKLAPEKSTPRQRTADETGEVSAVDNKLQILTREVYYLIRQRLEIERERQGHYYAGRLKW